MKIIKKYWPILLIFILILIPFIPVLNSSFFLSDDGEWMVIRLSAFHEALRTGQFPVRFLWRLNYGYGYPVTNFLYPLPFYIGELFHLMGLSFSSSIKWVFILSSFLGSLGMYFFSQKKWGTMIAFLVAIFYAYFPYRLFDVYVRGSLGEIVALAVAPWVFISIDQFFTEPKIKKFAISSLLIAGLIVSHNTLAFMFLPVVFGYVLFVYKNPKFNLFRISLIFLLSLIISCFFWLPALHDLQYVIASRVDISSYSQYFLTPQVFQYTLGLPFIVLCFLGLRNLNLLKSKIIVFWVTVLIIGLFFSSSLSQFIWERLPLTKAVQFPWRFMSLVMFAATVLLGNFLGFLKKSIFTLALLILFISPIFLVSINTVFRPNGYYETNDATTTVKDEYSNIWLKEKLKNRPDKKFEFISGDVLQKDSNIFVVRKVSLMQANVMYFPGIKVYVDGQEQVIEYESSGLVRFFLLPGQHIVQVRFEGSKLHMKSNLVSLFGIIFLLAILFPYRRIGHIYAAKR